MRWAPCADSAAWASQAVHEPPAWALALEGDVAALLGEVAAAMLGGASAAPDEGEGPALRPWLEGPFVGALGAWAHPSEQRPEDATAHCSASAFVRGLLEGVGEAERLLEWMKSQPVPGRPPMGMARPAAVQRVERYVLGALLHHTDGGAGAQATLTSPAAGTDGAHTVAGVGRGAVEQLGTLPCSAGSPNSRCCHTPS